MTSHTRNARALVAAVAALALGLTACGGDDEGTATTGGGSGGEETQTLSIAVAQPTAAYLLPAYAEEQGIFAKHGIDPDIKVIPPPGVLNLVVSGREQTGIFAGPVVERTTMEGADLRWLSVYVHKPLLSLMAQPDVESIADLKGKTLGTGAVGGTAQLLLDRLLRENGIDPATDLETRSVSSQQDARNALISGQLDAVLLGSPDDDVAAERGMKVLADLRTQDFEWPYAGVVTKEAFARDNPELMQRMRDAMSEAVEAWKADPVGAQAVIREATGADATYAKAAYEDVTPLLDADGTPREGEVANVIDELAQGEPGAADLQASDLILDVGSGGSGQ